MDQPKIVFLSKAERERIRVEKEREQIEGQKKIEEANKQLRRELLKSVPKKSEAVVTAKPVDVVEQRLAQAAETVAQAQQQSVLTSKRNKAGNFDWDETEDTLKESDYGWKRKSTVDPLASMSTVVAPIQHWSTKLTSEMTMRDWKIFREDHEISVTGSNGRTVPVPFRSWTESGLPRDLLDAVYKAGYTKPTPIQMQAIPTSIAGHDIVGLSSTGSGKTAAFVLPMLMYIKQLPPIRPETTALDGPYALVLAPSRELALQIDAEVKKFSSFCNIRSCPIVGGRSAEQQTLILSQGVELIVATPGRLVDSLDGKQTVLNQCIYVVLDEADKMIDLGFESFVNQILDAIPATNLKPSDMLDSSAAGGRYRITQMYSATMPPSVEKLTKKYLRNPITISVGSVTSGKPEIEQRLEFVSSESDKRKLLLNIMEDTQFPVMIFVSSKKQADYVGSVLDHIGVRAMVLHSGKTQERREEAINSFKAGRADVLVATDVAGRGIDIPNVQHVICYDMAKSIEDYTHRIGRTARGVNTKGIATSFILAKEDDEILPGLKKFLEHSKQFVPDQIQHVRTDDGKRQRRDDFML